MDDDEDEPGSPDVLLLEALSPALLAEPPLPELPALRELPLELPELPVPLEPPDPLEPPRLPRWLRHCENSSENFLKRSWRQDW